MTYVSESGHWYRPDGSPAYTINGKNGERPTTLRDARKEGLLPSVTTIIRVAAAPALENWKAEQLLLAALTLPRKEGESEADWLSRVRHDSKEQARRAADLGTKIHGAIEGHFQGVPPDTALWPHVLAVKDLLAEKCGEQEWKPEKSFASHWGYGGKIDLHSTEWVIDFKGKDGDLSELKVYDENIMQLAAYRRGVNRRARCANVFFSRTHPGIVRFCEVSAEDLSRGWDMFRALLEYWKYANRYAP